MLKKCLMCGKDFRTYIPSQKFCCYDCCDNYEKNHSKKFLSIDEIIAIQKETGMNYGQIVDSLERGVNVHVL